jgi:hypothetical protein
LGYANPRLGTTKIDDSHQINVVVNKSNKKNDIKFEIVLQAYNFSTY